MDAISTVVMLTILVAGFAAMIFRGQSQALVMPLVALAMLVMQGPAAGDVLQASFLEFAGVAVVFTAIAIPAHQLQRSGLFRLAGAHLGVSMGQVSLRLPSVRAAAVIGSILTLTWAMAAMFHNITSVLVIVPVAVAVCTSYRLPSKWLLCGILVASNLGGFSTAWGDTPNIIEARVWGLAHLDFLRQILPLNLVVVMGLTAAVTALSLRAQRDGPSPSIEDLAVSTARWKKELTEFAPDNRLLLVGLATLFGFIVIQFLSRRYEIAAGAAAIAVAVAGDRPADRRNTLETLGIEVYMTLLSVFVIAHTLSNSEVGSLLQSGIASTGGAPWAILLASYVGTLMSEAASWAAAAAPLTHAVNPSHGGAWALGAGICAGSSSILTAASAGIILWTQTKRFDGHAITFRAYLPFGLLASFAMLAFYGIAFSIMAAVGGAP
jgi:Na+/H+ antiporter NhaD/arsenite permease-like protein